MIDDAIDVRKTTRPERDAMIVKLRREGRKLGDIAKLVGVSEQRVHQIVQRDKAKVTA